MEYQTTTDPVDLYQIELEARRMRAEAARAAVAGLWRRIASLVPHRGASGARTA